MNRATSIIRCGAVATLLMLAACTTPPKVRVDKDATINFANYKTFAWLAPQKEPVKEEAKPIDGKEETKPVSPEVNSLVENRVRTAVITTLQAKGYRLDEEHPDFKVSYVLSVYERPKDSGMRIGIGAGGNSGNVGGGVGLLIPIGKRTDLIGAMTIDIIDAARNAQVWTGSYEDTVDTRGVSDANAQKLVATILARFPTDSDKK